MASGVVPGISRTVVRVTTDDGVVGLGRGPFAGRCSFAERRAGSDARRSRDGRAARRAGRDRASTRRASQRREGARSQSARRRRDRSLGHRGAGAGASRCTSCSGALSEHRSSSASTSPIGRARGLSGRRGRVLRAHGRGARLARLRGQGRRPPGRGGRAARARGASCDRTRPSAAPRREHGLAASTPRDVRSRSSSRSTSRTSRSRSARSRTWRSCARRPRSRSPSHTPDVAPGGRARRPGHDRARPRLLRRHRGNAALDRRLRGRGRRLLVLQRRSRHRDGRVPAGRRRHARISTVRASRCCAGRRDDVIAGGPFCARARRRSTSRAGPGLGVELDETALARGVERFARDGAYAFYTGGPLPRF